jgi:hypothetical protein
MKPASWVKKRQRNPMVIEEYLQQGGPTTNLLIPIKYRTKRKGNQLNPCSFYLSLFSSLNVPLSPQELRNLFSIANTILLSLDIFVLFTKKKKKKKKKKREFEIKTKINLSIVLCAIINLFLEITYIFQLILPLV